jgi:protein ImuB
VLARFGADGALCQRVARGIEGEMPGFRLFFPRSVPAPATTTKTVMRQVGFWGDSADADARAARAVVGVQELLGPEAVVRGRLQGGRGPAQRARLVPWAGGGRGVGDLDAHDPDGRVGDRGSASEAISGGPWPGQVPPPAPVVVLSRPLPTQLTDDAGRAVGVTGGGMATAVPARLSVAGGPWVEITGWAGPWPSDERWWSVRGRRRQARMQVVTAHAAHLLTREREGWWLEATYD